MQPKSENACIGCESAAPQNQLFRSLDVIMQVKGKGCFVAGNDVGRDF